MREYGQIQCSFWADPDIQQLSDSGIRLATYLLTGPHSNALGCYRLPHMYLMADFNWTKEQVEEAFAELKAIGFCLRCDDTDFILMPKFLRWNPIANGNIATARAKDFGSIPKRATIYPALCKALLTFGNHLAEPFIAELKTLLNEVLNGSKQPSETVSDRSLNPNQTRPDQNRTILGHDWPEDEPAESAGAKPKGYPAEFEAAWSAYPKRSGGNSKRGAFRAWEARVKAGADAGELLAGTTRYADFVRSEGKEGSRYVMQASTFFGPDEHYAEPWEAEADGGGDFDWEGVL